MAQKKFVKVDDPRVKTLRVRVSQLEDALIQQKAADAALSVSDYLRKCGMGRVVRSRAQATIINELRTIATLIKREREIDLASGTTKFDDEYLGVLKAVVETLGRLGIDKEIDHDR